ncbi:electron transfer flavoprotein subunit alpha/FixB family protein [Heliobacterium chlorum]|uniref:Electron transfer flavoprotein subunit alpha/FixB family protein n=2 Tax=Heliobacterium chlorum TaxID=2698 RepID=A0ABR7T495_HELCL|nr:electron transfer flavoprotein subunit alpha/FixB family protein [Heliobacterium chlorum]
MPDNRSTKAFKDSSNPTDGSKNSVSDRGPATAPESSPIAKAHEQIPIESIEAPKNLPAHGVWVYIEQLQGEVAPVSWELMGVGRQLADKLNCPLSGVLLGHDIQPLTELAFQYGADTLYAIDDPMLEPYTNECHSIALVQLCQAHHPEILLIGATTTGRDLSGSVATALRTGLTADCTQLDVDVDNRKLLQTRPAFGGNILATILCRDRWPQMATVRPRVFPEPEKQPHRRGALVWSDLGLDPSRTVMEVVDRILDERTEGYLDEADIIIAGGRGIGSKENFRYVEELAQAIGGMIGASRPAVESGWAPYSHQVGQTGFTVRPKLYIAAGISGAIQHLVGMQNSDVIVAINKDPDAPIFRVATYGIVGDAATILPALTLELGARMHGGPLGNERQL